jgi:Zn-dependent protease
MDGSWRIGRAFGIPIEIHVSWLFIFALIVWSLGADYFPMHHPGLGGAANWAAGVAAALLFFASIVAHEVAHSLVAQAHGIPVERITLFALGGLSALKRDADRPRAELLVALVGPALSLALGTVLWAIWTTLLRDDMTLGAIVFYVAYGNLALGAFNLIPAFPLDGGRALRAVLWSIRPGFESATLRSIAVARVMTVALVLIGLWQVVSAQATGGLWLILIAWMLWGAGDQERTRIAIESALRGRSIAPLVRFEFVTLDAEETLARAAERIVSAPAQPIYPVTWDDTLVGMITPATLNAVNADLWAVTRLHWLVRRAPEVQAIAIDTEAQAALSTLDTLGLDALPVSEPGVGVIGLLERSAVARLIEVSARRYGSAGPRRRYATSGMISWRTTHRRS